MKVQPLHDWAVVRPSEPEERTAGGLFIPDTAKDKPQEGVVESIGPGAYEEEKGRSKKKGEKKERRFVATVVKPGDRVVYAKYAGQTYKIDGEERILVRERDILGIMPARTPSQDPALIPDKTSGAGTTALMKPAAEASAEARKSTKKSGVKKTTKSVKKQTVKKKTAQKPAKAAAKKKSVKGKKAGKKK